MQDEADFNLDQVIWAYLPAQHFLRTGNEIMMEIFPGVVLFQIRVHSGKRGRHASLLTRRPRNNRSASRDCTKMVGWLAPFPLASRINIGQLHARKSGTYKTGRFDRRYRIVAAASARCYHPRIRQALGNLELSP
jgi:hypothetical protein